MIYGNILNKVIFIALYLICNCYLMRSAAYLSSVRLVGPTRETRFASFPSWPPFYSFLTRLFPSKYLVLTTIACLIFSIQLLVYIN